MHRVFFVKKEVNNLSGYINSFMVIPVAGLNSIQFPNIEAMF